MAGVECFAQEVQHFRRKMRNSSVQINGFRIVALPQGNARIPHTIVVELRVGYGPGGRNASPWAALSRSFLTTDGRKRPITQYGRRRMAFIGVW